MEPLLERICFNKRRADLINKINILTNTLLVLHCQNEIKDNIIVNFMWNTASKNHTFPAVAPDGGKQSKG